jgi:pyridoxal biosynthesis lyase PdxS
MKKTLLGVIALCVVGCASYPAPNAQVASALASVRGAGEAGAKDVPEAALHVKLAEEQIEQAQALMKDDDNKRAADVAARAFEDAELALAIAREDAAKKKLDQFAEVSRSAGGEQPPAAGAPTTNTAPTPGAQ